MLRGIPLVLGGGNGIDAPVDEDAELRVFVPLRLLVLDQRGPVRTIGAVVRLAIGFREKAIALRIVLAYRLLPLVIDLLGGFHVLCGREGIGGWRRRLGKKKRRRQRRELQKEDKRAFSYAGIVIDWEERCKRFHLEVNILTM